MIYILEFFEAVSPIVYILITILALVSLSFFLLLIWRIWYIAGMLLNILKDWRFGRGYNIRETMIQIEKFCRKYTDTDE